MKILSLKQPWAELVASGKKTIEIRKWNTKHRGEFFVHASKIPNKKGMEHNGFTTTQLPTGCIVGKATLTEVKTYTTLEEFNNDENKHFARLYEWNKKGKLYGFILEHAQRLPERPLKGKLSFFEVEY